MIYDFDTIHNRRGTDCYKFDFAKEMGMPEENLSLWVADMDFPVAEGIKNALQDVVEKGIFGYTGIKDDYFEAVRNWYQEKFHWSIQKEWLVLTPGVVFAVAAAVRAFTDPGQKVLIQQPVYYPFTNVIRKNHRIVVNNALKEVRDCPEGPVRYEMDFEDLEEKLKDPQLKLMILCSPHNPVGRVWKKEELIRAEELCLANGVILVSDEIHSDFVWTGRHYILASLDPRFEKNTVICTAPSKTFNLAGLQLSNIFIPDEKLRKKYKTLLDEESVGLPNQMGLAACKAAYLSAEEWLVQAKAYIHANILFMKDYIEQNLPALSVAEPEGTYLVWVDFRKLGLNEKELSELIVHKAGLWLDLGNMFGKEGEGFARFNVACSRRYLETALTQLKTACDQL